MGDERSDGTRGTFEQEYEYRGYHGWRERTKMKSKPKMMIRSQVDRLANCIILSSRREENRRARETPCLYHSHKRSDIINLTHACMPFYALKLLGDDSELLQSHLNDDESRKSQVTV